MSVLEQNSRRKMLLGQDGNALFLLLAANALVFLTIGIIKVIYLMSESTVAVFQTQVLDWFAIPASANIFASRPWTLFSYMFTHADIWSLISGLLWLWCFGFILQDIAGNKKIIPIYLYGGFIGGLAFLLAANTIPAFRSNLAATSALLGAGPSIMAIGIATTTIAPRYKIFPLLNGGIPLWVLTTVFVIITFATVGSVNGASAIAELAGGAIGFVFAWQLKKGNDWGEWMVNLVNWADDLFDPEKKRKQTEQQRLHYKAQKPPYVKTPHVTQQRIDDLLDKINQKGYHFLTDEEKDFLKKASKEEF